MAHLEDEFKDFHNFQRSNQSIYNESTENLHVQSENNRQHQSNNPFLDPTSGQGQLRRRSDTKFSSQNVQVKETAPSSPAALHTTLKHRKKVLYLLVIYVPLLLIPWVLTCVLANRPFGYSSYISQRGNISPDVLSTARAWMVFARMVNSLTAVLTVPILSAILAQAAVVYTQRRSLQQQLSLRQTLTLADRGWQDWWLLAKTGAGFSAAGRGASSLFLWIAAGALFISELPNVRCETPTDLYDQAQFNCHSSSYL